jgi:hypothetical protein
MEKSVGAVYSAPGPDFYPDVHLDAKVALDPI